MSYVKLIKLLYLLDREALLRWGRPVTTDRYVSMAKGPVVSQIYDLITEEVAPGEETFWHKHISTNRQAFEAALVEDPGDDELSSAEEDLINEIFQKHGKRSRWELVKVTHDLPEWQDPCGSSIPIEYRDILQAANRTEAEIAATLREIASLVMVDALVSPENPTHAACRDSVDVA